MGGVNVTALWVRTSWTKKSRGAGAGAARRNAAPVGFPLPGPGVQEVRMDESSGFEPRWRAGELSVDEVSLTEEDTGVLRVHLIDDKWGMPHRRRHPAVRIASGEWIRWQINYRFVYFCSGDWSYRLDTLNLAYGEHDTNVFLGTPTRFVDERARLF